MFYNRSNRFLMISLFLVSSCGGAADSPIIEFKDQYQELDAFEETQDEKDQGKADADAKDAKDSGDVKDIKDAGEGLDHGEEISIIPFENLCEPCGGDQDCAAGRCLDLGMSLYVCGAFCGKDNFCPLGFICKDVKSVSGITGKQCVPEGNQPCPCSEALTGVKFTCHIKNNFGSCPGYITCGGSGWSECEGNEPKPEECNGIDDNCNDFTDEELGQTTCGIDFCKHTVPNCLNGVPQACDPYEGAQDELCNEFDDNCNSFTDEDWPEIGKGCDGPDPDKCAGGIWQCHPDGSGVICVGDVINYTEKCNGIDDDCDGSTDEELGQTSCGVGICEHVVDNCVEGKPNQCNPLP
ncbi:MAG: hypothetical protein FJ088_15325, partial [Deltaproteobacteria bacterium]|nr:hypothetical protein [Deltaproteobacteria bacterium]